MAIENQFQKSVLRTALYHLLKNYEKSPERAARNVEELLAHLGPAASDCAFSRGELLEMMKGGATREECLSQIMQRLS